MTGRLCGESGNGDDGRCRALSVWQNIDGTMFERRWDLGWQAPRSVLCAFSCGYSEGCDLFRKRKLIHTWRYLFRIRNRDLPFVVA